MKHLYFLLFLFATIIITGCRQTKNQGTDSNTESQIIENEMPIFPEVVIPEVIIPLTGKLDSNEDETLIANMELLGKIWGFLKYHHPEVGKGKYDWDNELFQFLPEYLNVNNIEQRDETLLRWIEKYGELPACTTCKETASDAYQKPDFSWVENGKMSAALKEKIKEIYQNRHQGTHDNIRMSSAGNPEFLNEKPYSDSYPDTNLRLLALYRYWNMVQYFFPYKYLTDKNWNEVLKEYIPKFILAKTPLEYQLAVLQLTGETNDTHALYLQGADKIDSLRGTMYAPFQVRFIENKLTVTDYYKPELKDSAGLEIGDFITHINGKTIAYIIDSMKSYYPASNEAARMKYIAYNLVRSSNNSIRISYHSSGTIKQKELKLYHWSDLDLNKKSDKSSYDSILTDKDSSFIGYITLETIKETDIIPIKRSFMNAKGIIIDIRNYPNTFVPFLLGNFFTSQKRLFVKFTRGNVNNPGEFNFSNSLYLNSVNNFFDDFKTPEKRFQGVLVVIVNEETVSQAEYTAMAFRAGDNTIVIGSQTQGADGNVSEIVLPGGIKTWISGIGVYYPNGRGTQRTGIVPEVEVKPTIQGIREGRDEVLEKAIEIIK